MKKQWIIAGLFVVAVGTATAQNLGAQTIDMKSRMAGLEKANIKLQGAFFREDWGTMAQVADEIAKGEPVYAGLEERLKTVLGSDLDQVHRLDRQIRSSAARLSEAAGSHDLIGVQTELSILQDGCVSCHATYRPLIRSTLRDSAADKQKQETKK